MEEEGDAAQFFAARKTDSDRTQEEEWPEWARSLVIAWEALKSDRFFGSMGGMGPIYYTAISRYAEDLGMSRSDFDGFRHFISEMDKEYVAFCAKRDAEEAEARKNQT